MITHNQASFCTATLNTAKGPVDWLLPARSIAVAQTVTVPDYCTLEFHDFIWLELENLYDGDYGYTFVFNYKGNEWHLDQNHFGFNYLYERYINHINQYERERNENYS